MAKHPTGSSHNQLPNKTGADQTSGYEVASDPNIKAWKESKAIAERARGKG